MQILVEQIAHRLSPVYDDVALQYQTAWWMLEAITGTSESVLLAQGQVELTDEQKHMLDEWLEKHVDQRMPLQYLIGWVPFGELKIFVEPPVLIPRPETEEWCLRLCEQLKRLSVNNIAILDLCTGSGCIALALAKTLPMARIDATDISEKALALARKNAELNRIANVNFFHSDLYEHTPPSTRYDLIVSNPPYIAPAEWDALSPSVTLWEDKKALIADDNGLDIIERIIARAPDFLQFNLHMHQKNIPQLVIEIGYQQGHAVAQLMSNAGFVNVSVVKDLAGKDRVVQAGLRG